MITFQFLEADKPLTKTFTLKNGALEKSSYPNVYEVTSHPEDADTVQSLMARVAHHAAKGHCLLKGGLGRPLVKESRAGSTNSQAHTSWLLLDLDGVHSSTPSAFMDSIGLTGVDFGVQWSASMGLNPGGSNSGLRCHIFVLLAQPSHVSMLKNWLMHLNLTVPILASSLTLSSTNMALRWPLDVTTCQEDKLIYISPPALGPGIVDPYLNNRYDVVLRGTPRATLPGSIPTTAALKVQIEKHVATLRAVQGLPKRRSWATRSENGGPDYLANPDMATVTGQRTERGFTYFNLNGGDSWGYFHPEGNPYYIQNFKGEPTYKTSELMPEYWASVRKTSNSGSISTTASGSAATVYLAIREFVTGTYYNVIYTPGTKVLQLAPAKNEKQLRDFMKQHGQPMGEYVPDWTLDWNPRSGVVLDAVNKTLNTFIPSEVMKHPHDPTVVAPPPMSHKVIAHTLNYDNETIEWVYNWLAFVLQYRELSRVALLLHGTFGTGKGVFYHRILTGLFGSDNVTSKRLEEMEGEFTGFLDSKLFVMIDEIQTSSSLFHDKLTAKLKNIIAEPYISVRKMYQPAVMRRNYCNFLFCSNKLDAIEIRPNDRRYTVAPAQTRPLLEVMTSQDIDLIAANEIPQLYAYLMNFKCDITAAQVPLDNEAKRFMIELNRQTSDSVSDALLAGDIQFFVDALPTSNEPASMLTNSAEHVMRHKYVALVHEMVSNNVTQLSRDDLFTIYQYCCGKMSTSPNKFTTMLRHRNINLKVLKIGGRPVRGFEVTGGWQWKPENPPAIEAAKETGELLAKFS